MPGKTLYRLMTVSLLCASFAIPARALQSTPPSTDSSASAPSDASSTEAPAKKHKKAQQQNQTGGKKKNKKSKKNDSGPVTALCGDGTMSHELKLDKKGKPETPCRKNGGVAKKF